jgi:hypothetical protein
MLHPDFVEFRFTPERDPDGSRVQRVIAAYYKYERARAVREALAHGLAFASLVSIPCLIWPDRFPNALRALALAAWAACATGLALASAWEWRCRRKRALCLSDLREGATMAR